MARSLTALAVALAVLGAAVLPALAANPTVHAGGTAGNAFQPAALTVAVGQQVDFVNDGGFHNVVWEDGTRTVDQPSPTWPPASRTFAQPGTYRFRCEQHSGGFGSGMHGSVVVQAGGAGSPTPSPTPTTTPPPGGATPTPTPTPETSPMPPTNPSPGVSPAPTRAGGLRGSHRHQRSRHRRHRAGRRHRRHHATQHPIHHAHHPAYGHGG